ncbi:MAG: 2-C-methyl-D-erythritol 4-phosphate cytidylyltransferase [Clostridiales bacterium]|nr:2-C-methyl-D-erythritol 4-phosphate cytidylyltransferase [Clostridiales bacterium]
MVCAAILAGGMGLRMGGEIPKQFIMLAGKPVILRSIEAFANSGKIDKIYAAVSKEYEKYAAEIINQSVTGVEIVVGGKNRNETLYNVLKKISAEREITEEDVILTHDAVRPFITDEIIESNINAARRFGACSTVIPATDTIFESRDGEFIDTIPPRSEMFQGQTPQSFRIADLTEFYDNMSGDEFEIYTDACTVFIKNGKKPAMVMGSRDNIKLTYPEDLEKAEGIIARQNAKGERINP